MPCRQRDYNLHAEGELRKHKANRPYKYKFVVVGSSVYVATRVLEADLDRASLPACSMTLPKLHVQSFPVLMPNRCVVSKSYRSLFGPVMCVATATLPFEKSLAV